MTTRRRTVIFSSFVLFVVCALWVYGWLRLTHYRRQIETRYASAIAALEAGSRELPQPFATANDDAEAWQAARDKKESIIRGIENSFSGPEIIVVSWSLDGHHQGEGLVSKTSGYSRTLLVWSSDWSGKHTTRYGKTSDGIPLIAFTGWVMNGQKRHYEIGILATAADAW